MFLSIVDNDRCLLRRAALDPLLLTGNFETHVLIGVGTWGLTGAGTSEGSSGSKKV